eukprot:jgi/Picsp_1/1485/NSC_04963-R1_protein
MSDSERLLFGSAIRASIPSRFQDVSDFRPVPDHQEVFTDAAVDQSLIIEVVEMQNIGIHEGENGSQIGQFYFQDLLETNDAQGGNIRMTRRLGQEEIRLESCSAFLVEGEMAAQKGRSSHRQGQGINKIHILLAIIRIPEKQTDILISLNTPMFIHEDSVSAQDLGAGFKSLHESADALFLQILESFKITDWSLFG